MSKPTDRLTWEEPPPVGYGIRASYEEIARKLKARKGEWAVIGMYDKSRTAAGVANNVRKGISRHFRPEGYFESKSRTVDGEHRVYARYVGEGESGERPASDAPEGA